MQKDVFPQIIVSASLQAWSHQQVKRSNSIFIDSCLWRDLSEICLFQSLWKRFPTQSISLLVLLTTSLRHLGAMRVPWITDTSCVSLGKFSCAFGSSPRFLPCLVAPRCRHGDRSSERCTRTIQLSSKCQSRCLDAQWPFCQSINCSFLFCGSVSSPWAASIS